MPYVQELLDIHDKYTELVGTGPEKGCFQGHSIFHKAMKEAFEVFVNKDIGKTSTAELLSNFCDNLLKKSGLFVGVGIPATSEGNIEINPMQFLAMDPTLIYSVVGTVQDMRELVDMAAEGKVKSHIGRTGPLSELPDVFDELEAGKYVGRAVITDLGS